MLKVMNVPPTCNLKVRVNDLLVHGLELVHGKKEQIPYFAAGSLKVADLQTREHSASGTGDGVVQTSLLTGDQLGLVIRNERRAECDEWKQRCCKNVCGLHFQWKECKNSKKVATE